MDEMHELGYPWTKPGGILASFDKNRWDRSGTEAWHLYDLRTVYR
jgi:hypothetical protein